MEGWSYSVSKEVSKNAYLKTNGLSKNTERGRAVLYLEYDYHALFSVNPKIYILLKT